MLLGGGQFGFMVHACNTLQHPTTYIHLVQKLHNTNIYNTNTHQHTYIHTYMWTGSHVDREIDRHRQSDVRIHCNLLTNGNALIPFFS